MMACLTRPRSAGSRDATATGRNHSLIKPPAQFRDRRAVLRLAGFNGVTDLLKDGVRLAVAARQDLADNLTRTQAA
ncbi:MAG TPA: hypothetical protein VFC78_11340 [Tepidisphaeraceae bacterium]|nr:hypothetical protein [Tepidisphaeraceae bacterium]